MPLIHLAKLADLKNAGDWTGTELDTRLLRYLARASSKAEHLAGLADGALRREADRVEYPDTPSYGRSVSLRLNARPIESISEILERFSPDTAWDDADTIAATDYQVRSAELAEVRRVRGYLWHTYDQGVRVTYTAGLADPARVSIALATATWTEATRTLTQVGAFASYSFTAGDKIAITGGTGVTPGCYLITARTDDDAIVLGESISTAGIDLATGDITSAYAGMIDVPDDLQEGVIQQAMQLHNTADTAGLEKIDMGEAGGSFTTRVAKAHPALVEAVARYRRLM